MPCTSTTSGRSGDVNLKLPDVLTELGISRSAFYRLRARGQAPRCIKLPNGQIRIRRSDLDSWFNACEELAA
ncbi:helix-turn-helix domain-containing protein [Streptomyces exfoliatus]|uniref:Helix-turn-helix domain-containing protein n=1 Tax=Streptomyces exfoliatus TaxID=1905 RepID=A0ABV3CNI2_STREX